MKRVKRPITRPVENQALNWVEKREAPNNPLAGNGGSDKRGTHNHDVKVRCS